LSIAERAVCFQGGTIEASNIVNDKAELGCLLMKTRLPLA
jgi:hypothetical protein